jgi:hypothetical protein
MKSANDGTTTITKTNLEENINFKTRLDSIEKVSMQISLVYTIGPTGPFAKSVKNVTIH